MTAGTMRWIDGLVIALLVVTAGNALGGTAAQKCQQSKNKEVGKYAYCRQKVEAKFAIAGDATARTAGLQKCRDKYDAKWPGLEAKAVAAGDVCPSVGDQADIRGAADTYTSDVATALAGGALPNCPDDLATCESDLAACAAAPPGLLLQTGQTTCWDNAFTPTSCTGTGQDGETQRGLARSYTDNGDGTITDNRTGLMWEKLSSFDGSINDSEDKYSWQTAFTVKIAALNGSAFAGYTDWRLPNQFELYSLIDFGKKNPAVSAPFDTNCEPECGVLACSCTLSDFYWSSTSYEDGPMIAWYVDFSNGYVGGSGKSFLLRVRGVRGGS
jgi:hypothetical protein